MSVFYDVCKGFNEFHHFLEFPINSGCQNLPTCARFSMISIDFLVIASGVYIYRLIDFSLVFAVLYIQPRGQDVVRKLDT